MKKAVALFLAVMMAFCSMSCGLMPSNEDPNAQQYADFATGLLDAIFRENFTAYREMTGESETAVQRLYDNNVANTAHELKNHFGLRFMTTEDKEVLHEVVSKVYSKIRYTVTSTAQDENGAYVVTIDLGIMDFLDLVQKDLDAYVDEMNQKMVNRELDNLSTDEYDLLLKDEAVKIMQARVDNTAANEHISVQLPFKMGADGSATITTDTLHMVSQKLLHLN